MDRRSRICWIDGAVGPRFVLVTRPVVVGSIALSFHRAAAAVVQRILEKHGHDVVVVEAAHEELFARQARGEIDVLVSAWLPSSHGSYLAPYRDRVRVLSPLYDPYCIWAVPPYVPVESVTDLVAPEIAERMTRVITGINAGAGISRFSARMVVDYGLDRRGYSFVPGPEAAFVERVERGVAAGEWFVIPLWRPQQLNRRHGLRAIDEPKGLLGGVDAACPVVTEEAFARIGSAAMTELDALRLGNDGVEEIDTLITVEGLAPLSAADRFLAAHRPAGKPGADGCRPRV